MFPLPKTKPAPYLIRDAAKSAATVVLGCKACGHAVATPAARLAPRWGDKDLHQLHKHLHCKACGRIDGEVAVFPPWVP